MATLRCILHLRALTLNSPFLPEASYAEFSQLFLSADNHGRG
jgi:hypothetical protein